MQRAGAGVAVVLVVVGAVWIGQGLGFIPGSFMTGDPFWALAGAATAGFGVVLGWSRLRSRR